MSDRYLNIRFQNQFQKNHHQCLILAVSVVVFELILTAGLRVGILVTINSPFKNPYIINKYF